MAPLWTEPIKKIASHNNYFFNRLPEKKSRVAPCCCNKDIIREREREGRERGERERERQREREKKKTGPGPKKTFQKVQNYIKICTR